MESEKNKRGRPANAPTKKICWCISFEDNEGLVRRKEYFKTTDEMIAKYPDLRNRWIISAIEKGNRHKIIQENEFLSKVKIQKMK